MSAADVWGDDFEDDTADLDREWAARREEFWNSGYREGIEAGKHETVQEGFDAGYAAGSTAGYEWGVLRGGVMTAQAAANRGLLPTELASRASSDLTSMAPGVVADAVCQGLMHEQASQEGATDGEASGASDAVKQDASAGIVAVAERRAVAGMEQLGLQLDRNLPPKPRAENVVS